MVGDGSRFELPGRLDSCLRLLERQYSKQNERLLREIVVNGQANVVAGDEFDQWNGGSFGHTVTIVLPDELFLRLAVERLELEWRIRDDLQRIGIAPNESFSKVTLVPLYEQEPGWRERTGIYRPPATLNVDQDVRERIWGHNPVRLFLSHKVSIKGDAKKLKDELARIGISAFVAHESIEATLDWQNEIENALWSMDALVALVTPDFGESDWTDQEVGYALGRRVPVIPVSLGRNPYGFMARVQALTGSQLSDPEALALKLFELLKSKSMGEKRLLDAAIFAFERATSFDDARWKAGALLTRFARAEQDQIERILHAFKTNPQISGSYGARRQLPLLLKRWTGSDWRFDGRDIVLEVKDADDLFVEEDLPF